jgi:hypothetical protein
VLPLTSDWVLLFMGLCISAEQHHRSQLIAEVSCAACTHFSFVEPWFGAQQSRVMWCVVTMQCAGVEPGQYVEESLACMRCYWNTSCLGTVFMLPHTTVITVICATQLR